eukprot:8628583-Lingulodinium_polyedra.AAC.1
MQETAARPTQPRRRLTHWKPASIATQVWPPGPGPCLGPGTTTGYAVTPWAGPSACIPATLFLMLLCSRASCTPALAPANMQSLHSALHCTAGAALARPCMIGP